MSAFKIVAAKTKDKILIQFSNQVTGEGSGREELLKPSTVPINLTDTYLKAASTQLAIMNQKLSL